MNLEEDVERRTSFLEQFPGVPWVRFPACRGGLMWGEIARGLGWLGDIRETYGGEKIEKPRWGTVGCSLSHLFCLQMASICGGIVLFPDDLLNTKQVDLPWLVREAMKHRPAGAGWIKLKNHEPNFLEEHVSGGQVFRRLAAGSRDDFQNKGNLGSGAVIILQEQARWLLDRLPPVTSRGIDYELREMLEAVPGGCWEMLETGIVTRARDGDYGGSSRKRIDGRGKHRWRRECS